MEVISSLLRQWRNFKGTYQKAFAAKLKFVVKQDTQIQGMYLLLQS